MQYTKNLGNQNGQIKGINVGASSCAKPEGTQEETARKPKETVSGSSEEPKGIPKYTEAMSRGSQGEPSARVQRTSEETARNP